MLLGFLAPKNLSSDIPEILSYLADLHSRLLSVNRGDTKTYIEDNSNTILRFLLKEASEHFYSSKLRLYVEEEDKEYKPERPLSEEETRQQMEEVMNHPLFMTEIPKDIKGNQHLEALQAIKYEGEASDVGRDLYEQADKSLGLYRKTNKFAQLKEAMAHICNAIDHCLDDGTVLESFKLKALLFRARLNAMVKNFRYALDDLNKAILFARNSLELKDVLDPMLDCLCELERFQQAAKLLSYQYKTLENEHQNGRLSEEAFKEFKSYYEEKNPLLSHKTRELEKRLEEQEALKSLDSQSRLKTFEELNSDGIALRRQVHSIPNNCEAYIYKDEATDWHFPVLIVYEEFNMTDYIQDVHWETSVLEILEMVLSERLPWDKEARYTVLSARAFLEMNTENLAVLYFPLTRNDTLKKVLRMRQSFINGFPVISIASGKFLEWFLTQKSLVARKILKEENIK